MINRATARKHLRRLAGLPGGDIAQRVDACESFIQQEMRDETELREVVGRLERSEKFFPVVSRIWQELCELRIANKPEVDVNAPYRCAICSDTNWRVVTIRGIEAVERCDHKQEPDPVATVPAGMGDEELGV